MSTATRVIKNTGFLYAKMGITMFISLYTTRLILNSLGAEDFGIFNIVGGSIAMLGFLNAAMASATQRFMSYAEGEGNPEKQKSIFNISFVLHFGIALAAGIALLIAGHFFFNGILNIPANRMHAARMIYYFMIISTMFTMMTVPYDAVLNAHENMKYYAIVGIVESVLKLLAAVIVVHTFTDKLILYGALMAGISLIVMLIMRLYCHKHYTECLIAPRKYWQRGLMREMTGFAGWNFMGASISMISMYGQGIILNHFFGALLNAAQGITSQINGQLQVLSLNMLKALNPVFGKSAGANNQQLLLKSALLGAKYSTALFTLIAIPIFIEAPYILKLWLTNIPEWTIVFVRFQLLKSFIEFQFLTLPQIIQAIGKIKKYTLWNSLSNLLQLPAIYLLFKHGFPPYSMYIATIIFGNLIVYAGALYYAKIYCQLSVRTYFRKVILPLNTVSAIALLILYWIKTILPLESVLLLIGLIVFSVLLFGFLFFIIGCTKEERILILLFKTSLLNKFSHKIK